VELLHGTPILFTGTGNLALIKSILDLHFWHCNVSKGRDIDNTRRHGIKLTYGHPLEVLSAGGGSGLPFAPEPGHGSDLLVASEMFPTRLLLPTLNNAYDKALFESPWYQSVPIRLDSISAHDEQNIIEQRISELNGKFNTNLAALCTVDREVEDSEEWGGTDDALAKKRFILIGASHMTRLACAFEDLGATVIDLSIPGWRGTASAVEEIRGNLSAVLSEEFEGETLVVYQLFDNSCYMSCNAEGERALPVKLLDNKYHIPGRLVMVNRDEFRDLFTAVLPILRAGQQHTKILLTPLVRYLLHSCCRDISHITNRCEPRYAATISYIEFSSASACNWRKKTPPRAK
jgi:hypothetical protein